MTNLGAQKLVIIGNGMAPGRMLEHLFEQAPGLYDVTIFNAEPRVNYDRIMLSPVLSGEKTFEDIIIHGDGWYIENNVTLYKGHRIVGIDRNARTVTSDHGVTESYDKLVIATGSVPFIIPVPARTCPASSPIATSTMWTQCCSPPSRAKRRSSSAAVCSVWKPPPALPCAAWT